MADLPCTVLRLCEVPEVSEPNGENVEGSRGCCAMKAKAYALRKEKEHISHVTVLMCEGISQQL